MPRTKLLKDKNEIIEAALKIIREEGLAAVSMRRLSKDMGVSSMTLYNYVRNTQDVLREILIRSFNRIYESMYAQMNDFAREGLTGVRAYAKAYALALYRFAVENSDICAYLIGEGRRVFHDDAELRPFYNPFGAFLMRLRDADFAREMGRVCRLYDCAVRAIISDITAGIQRPDEAEFVQTAELFIDRMFPAEQNV